MSLALVQSRALLGLHAAEVTVEVHLANGLPSFSIVSQYMYSLTACFISPAPWHQCEGRPFASIGRRVVEAHPSEASRTKVSV